MNIPQLKVILKQPLPIIISKAKSLVIGKITHRYWSKKYVTNDFRNDKVEYHIEPNLVNLQKINTQAINKDVATYLMNMYIQHRFDLLGSGWVENSYQSEPVGLEGIKFPNTFNDLIIDNQGEWLSKIVIKKHLNKSKEIWKKILAINPNYNPIDWQKDYKVGFRFSAKIPYNKQVQLVTAKGIDLKMPWELSRLQHLPQMALFTKQFPTEKEIIIQEFKNQVLDFMMTNPAGMGVNWNCTMDVGIRAANLVLAYDWFNQIDEKQLLDDYFKSLFTNYIYWHGKHIVNNFEHNGGITSNHYLGNIAGLTFVSSYLIGKKEFNNWFLLSLQELNKEMSRQFFKDGSNFEGSTAYHRLSGEMFTYSTIIANAISEKRKKEIANHKIKKGLKQPCLTSTYASFNFEKGIFDSQYYSYFKNMALFTMAYRKRNGDITQIGDNDSGRFFRLSPTGEFLALNSAIEKYQNLTLTNDYKEEKYWDENHINHDSFLSLLNGFIKDDKLISFSNKYAVEYSFSEQFIANKLKLEEQSLPIKEEPLPSFKLEKEKEFLTTTSNSLIENIKVSYFKDFGMLVFKSDNLYLNVAFGSNINSHPSLGHQHNDKLSIELNIEGNDIILDPGTYIYTPLPEKRNFFRSVKNHNTIHVEEEQNSFIYTRRGLFNMDKEVVVQLLKLNNTEVALLAKYRDTCHLRQIKILSDKIIIEDSCNKEFNQNFNCSMFSNGYGKLIKQL